MAPKRPAMNAGEEEGESSRKRSRASRIKGSSSSSSARAHSASTASAVASTTNSSVDVIGYAVARNLKFRTYIAAAYWLEQGCPRLDFLTTLGLQGLADVKWNITCPALIREFVANYNLKTNQTVVKGHKIIFTAQMISEKFKLSSEGVLSFKRSIEGNEQVKLFKDGAYQKDLGYRHDMLVDPSLAPIFSLVAEVVQLRVSSGYTSRNLIEIIVQGLQGYKINWSEYMLQNILKELRRMKQKAHSTVVFGAGPLITHMFQDFPEADDLKPSAAGFISDVSTEPLLEIKSPVPTINHNPSTSINLEVAIPDLETAAEASPPEHAVAIPITNSKTIDTKPALEAIDLNSSCSVLTTVESSQAVPSLRQPPLASTLSSSIFPTKSAFIPASKVSEFPAAAAAALPPPCPSEVSITSPFSKMFYGINPKIKITSLFSEATRTLNELYSEEEVQKRVNQMLNATTGQLNFERMIRERTEEDLKEARRQRDQFQADLMMAHTRLALLEKSESQLKDSNERLDKAKTDLEDDLENYNCMLMEHQEKLSKLKQQCDDIAAQLQTVEVNYHDIRQQVDDVRHQMAEKEGLLRRAQGEATEAQRQNQQSQQEQTALQQHLDDLQDSVTVFRTELAVRELPYDESIWEKIKELARKHTQEEYGKLVDTIADLQEQLEQQQARQEDDDDEED